MACDSYSLERGREDRSLGQRVNAGEDAMLFLRAVLVSLPSARDNFKLATKYDIPLSIGEMM